MTVIIGATAQPWRAHAACLGRDPETWFPVGTTGPAEEQIAKAKAICRTCPVRKPCLDYAIASNQECGIYGGRTEGERRSIRRSRQRDRRAS